jgi:hypothetical protein
VDRVNGSSLKPYLKAEEVKGMNLGTCCVCGGTDNVVHILTLAGHCPILGRGWGCLRCGLEPHGAVAVICNACRPELVAGRKQLVWICTGIPAVDGRTPAGEMVGGFDHDPTKHVLGG